MVTRDELLAEHLESCKRQRSAFQEQLESFEGGAQTFKDRADTTAQTIADLKRDIANLDQLIAKGIGGNTDA